MLHLLSCISPRLPCLRPLPAFLPSFQQGMVDETKHLPVDLAERGYVDINSTEISRLIGKVFLQRAAVNLMSSVLDVPEASACAERRRQDACVGASGAGRQQRLSAGWQFT